MRALAGEGPASFSAGPENVLDVRVWRPHPGAQPLIIRFPEPSAHLPAHVHLDQRELLGILRADLVEVAAERRIAVQSSTARTEALRGKRSITAISPKQSPSLRIRRRYSCPPQDFSTAAMPASRTNIESAWSCFAEKELVRRDGHDRAQAEQELEDVDPDSAENGHALQEFDTRLLHGDTARVVAIMIRGGSVRNQLQDPNFSKGVLWVIVWWALPPAPISRCTDAIA